MEGIVPSLSPPICVNASERRDRLCVINSVERGHIILILAHLPTAVSGGKGHGYSMPSHQQSEIAATVMC